MSNHESMPFYRNIIVKNMETRALLARTLRSLDNCDDYDINFSFGNLEKSAKELSERLKSDN